MRVAMIGSRGLVEPYSGIETALQALCPRLVERGHDVTVFGDEHNLGVFEGVRLERVPALRTKHLETVSRSFVATLLAMSQRFDVIHFHDVAPALWAPLTRLARKPTVLTLHSLDWKRGKWSAASKAGIRAVERIAVRAVDRIAVVSESLHAYLKAEHGLDSEVLPNAVTGASYVAPGPVHRQFELQGGKYVLYAGRLTRDKAPHDLIRAFRTLDTDYKLVIAGESRYDDAYDRDLAALAAGSATIFTGRLAPQHLRELMSNARVFVLPSQVEGR
jgi:glycosyltransferase involved in cell wall biosynthesis